jgi:DNA end-binding protein Ku
VTRGKEELVLIRPYQNGLLLHTMFYTNGIRDFNQVRKGETARVSEEENRLALGLIDQLASEEFAPDTYRDEHRERVLAFLQEKGKGQLITPPSPAAPARGQVIDIMEALKQSMQEARLKKPVGAEKKRAKRTGS